MSRRTYTFVVSDGDSGQQAKTGIEYLFGQAEWHEGVDGPYDSNKYDVSVIDEMPPWTFKFLVKQPSYQEDRLLTNGFNCKIGIKSDGTFIIAGELHESVYDIHSWETPPDTIGARIIQLSMNELWVIGLKSDGTCVATSETVSGWRNVIQVSAGSAFLMERAFFVGVQSDGTCVITLRGKYFKSEWEDIVQSWTNIKKVSAGSNVVGLKTDGTCVATGPNFHLPYFENPDYAIYNFIDEVKSWRNIVQISARANHVVGLKSDGTCVCAGYFHFSPTPIRHNVSSWTNIVQISTDRRFTIGLKSDGTCVSEGLNTHGQCDVSSWTDIKEIATGAYNTVGLKFNGTCVFTGLDVFNIKAEVESWNLN